PADAALAACLMPAMRHGGSLAIPGRVSPRVLRNQREYQGVQAAWSHDWPLNSEPLQEVEVSAPPRSPESPGPAPRVAAFFSGGVDSWATVIANPDITDLIFVRRGVDLLERAPHQRDMPAQVEARLGAAAAELGTRFHVVET